MNEWGWFSICSSLLKMDALLLMRNEQPKAKRHRGERQESHQVDRKWGAAAATGTPVSTATSTKSKTSFCPQHVLSVRYNLKEREGLQEKPAKGQEAPEVSTDPSSTGKGTVLNSTLHSLPSTSNFPAQNLALHDPGWSEGWLADSLVGRMGLAG